MTLMACYDLSSSDRHRSTTAPRDPYVACNKAFHALNLGREFVSDLHVGPGLGLPWLVLEAHYMHPVRADNSSMDVLYTQARPARTTPETTASTRRGAWGRSEQFVQVYHLGGTIARSTLAAAGGDRKRTAHTVSAAYTYACDEPVRLMRFVAHLHDLGTGAQWAVSPAGRAAPAAAAAYVTREGITTMGGTPKLHPVPHDQSRLAKGDRITLNCSYSSYDGLSQSERATPTYLGLGWHDEMCELWFLLRHGPEATEPVRGSCFQADTSELVRHQQRHQARGSALASRTRPAEEPPSSDRLDEFLDCYTNCGPTMPVGYSGCCLGEVGEVCDSDGSGLRVQPSGVCSPHVA